MTDRIYPEQGEAVATVLGALGVELVNPSGIHCCGLIPNNSGDIPHAKSMAKSTIERLEQVPADYIVSGSASCVAMLGQDYLHLFRDEPEWRLRAEKLSAKDRRLHAFPGRRGADSGRCARPGRRSFTRPDLSRFVPGAERARPEGGTALPAGSM
jgi:hypothetical protein